MHALRTVAAGLLLAAIAAGSVGVPAVHAALHAAEDRAPALGEVAIDAPRCAVCAGLVRLASEPPAPPVAVPTTATTGVEASIRPAPVRDAPRPALRLGRAPPAA